MFRTIILGLCFLLFSCNISKQLALFQDLNGSSDAKPQDVRVAAFEALTIQVDDQLQVVISSISPEAAQLFNLMGNSVISASGMTQNMQSVYTVSPSGTITIPVIGDVTVLGLTTGEAKEVIRKEVVEYLKDAIISTSLVNFRITVMGEVTRPSTYQVAGEKINVLQALGLAGDLTVFGKRNNVKVIRKADDKVEVGTLNLNHSSVMRSPYYDLKQNDIILVESTSRKGLQAEGLNILVPAATSIISLIILAMVRLR